MEELCKDCSPSLPWKEISSEISSNYQILTSSEGSRIHHGSEGTFWPNPHWKNCQTDPPITQLAATEPLLHRAMRRCYDNRNGRLVKVSSRGITSNHGCERRQESMGAVDSSAFCSIGPGTREPWKAGSHRYGTVAASTTSEDRQIPGE